MKTIPSFDPCPRCENTFLILNSFDVQEVLFKPMCGHCGLTIDGVCNKMVIEPVMRNRYYEWKEQNKPFWKKIL